MFFELRDYRTKPGQRDNWVKYMEEIIIPFQSSKGMVIVGSWVDQEEDDHYIWMRRFEDDADLEAGYEDQVLLSADFANSIDLKSNWGIGFATTIVQFVPKLRHAGVDEVTLHKITVDNPRRFLAFVPPEA